MTSATLTFQDINFLAVIKVTKELSLYTTKASFVYSDATIFKACQLRLVITFTMLYIYSDIRILLLFGILMSQSEVN